jgi:glucose/arabinose dehydrogenase
VVAQSGNVFRVPRDGSKAERTVFLDLTKQVYMENWEEGLLGLQFDPEYAQNGFVYVDWTEKVAEREGDMGGTKAKSVHQSVISRFTTKPGDNGVRVVDPASELRLMEVFQPYGNHKGGTLRFGPDKMLYIAFGDGGLANDPFGNGQNKKSVLGKVLRIDVRGASKEKPYSIPEDNPFAKDAEARGEIWCWGMRNPWRISFDRETGDLWCGDVGQDRIEEVDRLVKGGNYGWNFMEGNERFKGRRQKGEMPTDLIAPIVTYPHPDGLSITGGHVYRGKTMPPLQGWYLYGDFVTLRIWAVKEDRQGGKHQVIEIGRAPAALSSFAEEPDGELLATCFDGHVYRIGLAPKEKDEGK